MAIDTDQSVALHYVLTIDTDQVYLVKYMMSNRWLRYHYIYLAIATVATSLIFVPVLTAWKSTNSWPLLWLYQYLIFQMNEDPNGIELFRT